LKLVTRVKTIKKKKHSGYVDFDMNLSPLLSVGLRPLITHKIEKLKKKPAKTDDKKRDIFLPW
jgi:hypothetical protein